MVTLPVKSEPVASTDPTNFVAVTTPDATMLVVSNCPYTDAPIPLTSNSVSYTHLTLPTSDLV